MKNELNIEKMREEFEAAFVEEMVSRCGEGIRSSVRLFFVEKEPDGAYSNPIAHAGWWAWQASRAALVIELPQVVAYEAGYDSHRENEYASQSGELFDADEVFALNRSIEVREAIEAAGVKVRS